MSSSLKRGILISMFMLTVSVVYPQEELKLTLPMNMFSQGLLESGAMDKPVRDTYGIDESFKFLLNSLDTESQVVGLQNFYTAYNNYSIDIERYYINVNSSLMNQNLVLQNKLDEDSKKFDNIQKELENQQILVGELEGTSEELDQKIKELKKKRVLDTLKIGGIGVSIGICVAVPVTVILMNKMK